MARDGTADGTNNVVNGEWRRGQRDADSNGGCTKSRGSFKIQRVLSTSRSTARVIRKKIFPFFLFSTLRVHTLAHFFLGRIFIPNNFDLNVFIALHHFFISIIIELLFNLFIVLV